MIHNEVHLCPPGVFTWAVVCLQLSYKGRAGPVEPATEVKGEMYSGPEIHGFRRGGFQYGVFRISVRIPNFAMAKMSPRESQLLEVEVVRWAPILHMYNSTHQDLTFHRECLSISYGITPYCVEN